MSKLSFKSNKYFHIYLLSLILVAGFVIRFFWHKGSPFPKHIHKDYSQYYNSPTLSRSTPLNFSEKGQPVEKVYDQIYSNIYDELWFDEQLYKWEAQQIKETIHLPKSDVSILDAGCGTGTHYFYLAPYKITGLDISQEMLKVAKRKNPNGYFVLGNMSDRSLFEKEEFSHIISMYEATFYNKNYMDIFKNYAYWLQPEGFLIFTLIDRDNLSHNVIANDLSGLYKKQGEHIAGNVGAITQYDNLKTDAWWEFFPKEDLGIYHEIITFNDGHVEKKEHQIYLPVLNKLEQNIKNLGFRLIDKKLILDDPSNILYIFQKRKNGFPRDTQE